MVDMIPAQVNTVLSDGGIVRNQRNGMIVFAPDAELIIGKKQQVSANGAPVLLITFRTAREMTKEKIRLVVADPVLYNTLVNLDANEIPAALVSWVGLIRCVEYIPEGAERGPIYIMLESYNEAPEVGFAPRPGYLYVRYVDQMKLAALESSKNVFVVHSGNGETPLTVGLHAGQAPR